jgi:hypothetical protein
MEHGANAISKLHEDGEKAPKHVAAFVIQFLYHIYIYIYVCVCVFVFVFVHWLVQTISNY